MKITVDYRLLKKQKASLFKVISSSDWDSTVNDHLEGILSLLDAIGDKRPFQSATRGKK